MKKMIAFFNYVCMLFPFGTAILCAAVCLLGGWDKFFSGHGADFYFLPQLNHKFFALICVLMIVGFFFLVVRIEDWLKGRNVHQNVSCAFWGTAVFLFTFAVRFIIIYAFREDLSPFSDFLRVWNIAHENYGDALRYYSLFPSYLNYSVYLQKVVAILGDQYVYVLFLNALLTGITGVCIYFIAKNVIPNDKIAILAALLYAFMPSNIVYTAVGTPDFLTIGCNTVGVLLLVKAQKSVLLKKKLCFALLGGIAVGAGSVFKTFGLVILIAFSMACIFSEISKTIITDNTVKDLLKKIMAVATCLVLVWGGHILVTKLAIKQTEHIYQLELDYGTAIPHYLLIGLNTEGEGQIHLGTKAGQYYAAYLENGMDAAEAKEYVYRLLKDDWHDHPSQIAPMLVKKTIWAWQDDLIPVFYFNNYVGLNPDSVVEKFIFGFSQNILPSIAQIYYALIILFAIFGAMHFSKSDINFQWEFILLIIFGYWCMIMLSEAQSRYKCLVMPCICVIGAVGLNDVVCALKKKRNWPPRSEKVFHMPD